MTVTQHPSLAGNITLVTLTNPSGARVTLSTLGAGVTSIYVPDRQGRLADVCLGYANPADYLHDGPCAGKVPGRYANRIAHGRFSLNGKEYRLPINNGPNSLHGGPEGFQNKIWTLEHADESEAVFTLVSPDGDMGYPGRLTSKAVYRWSDDNVLSLTLEAVTDAPTIVNLTNHTYLNLAGYDAGSVLDHQLQLMASQWLPTDDTQIPTGELAEVHGTPMDFTEPKALGRDIHASFDALRIGKGYDHCWALDGWHEGEVRPAACLSDDHSGRRVIISTDQPGIQVYTGNWLAGSPLDKSGRPYDDYDGVALECQNFPDAPNQPGFPSAVLRPGELYRRRIIWAFDTF